MATRISEETRNRVALAWADMLGDVASAKTLAVICARYELTPAQIRGYKDSAPGARQEWNDARRESAQAFLDQLIEVTNNPDIEPARVRVMIDSLRFLIERLDPDTFSPKTRAEITHKVIDLNQAIRDANLRLAHARQPLLPERDITADVQVLSVTPALHDLV